MLEGLFLILGEPAPSNSFALIDCTENHTPLMKLPLKPLLFIFLEITTVVKDVIVLK